MIQNSERGRELAEDRRRRLKRAVERHGIKLVVARLDLAEGTVWRACAGGRLYHGTEVAIDQGLAALECAAP